MPFRVSVVAGLLALFAFTAPATADPVEIHYAPVENLERVDVALLQSARSKIDARIWFILSASEARSSRRCRFFRRGSAIAFGK